MCVRSTRVDSALTSTYLCRPSILKDLFVQVFVEKSGGICLGIFGSFPPPRMYIYMFRALFDESRLLAVVYMLMLQVY